MLRDAPILIGHFSMLSPMSPLCYRGEAINLTPSMRDVCWAMMKSCPRPIGHDVLLQRLDSESSGNVIEVYLSKIRKALTAVGAPIPFTAVRSRRWSGVSPAVVWAP